MLYEQYIGLLDEESVLAECGPMRLIIGAWKVGQPQLDLACLAAKQAFGFLARIATYRLTLSLPPADIGALPNDDLAVRMVTSVRAIGDDDLTPMAAVAGTIADAVADWLFDQGATRVIVENGGDISIRLAEGETVIVGVRPKLTSREISHVMTLDSSSPSWGVTTSGFGGRSFTRGIASAVTTLSFNASIADAASTAIANACFVEDDSISQVPAEQIDPNTDLSGLQVTINAGSLSPAQMITAIDRAQHKAERLSQRGVIIGALIALDTVFVITDGMKPYALSLSETPAEAYL